MGSDQIPGSGSGSRKSSSKAVVIVIGLLVLIGLVIWFWEPQNAPTGGRPFRGMGVPVLTAVAATQDVPVYINGIGTAKAYNTVTVVSQVNGAITSINFKEGQDVEKGDLLAEIDRRTYQAAYDQAIAKKAQDEALLANAKLDLDRYTRLSESNAATKQQADTQRSLVQQYQAQVDSDQAAIDSAKTTLDYTRITAPISGRTGIRQVDEGNVVQGTASTPLVVITQVKPISVQFPVPQQRISEINAEQARTKQPLKVDALAADGKTILDSGVLKVIDNQIDTATGTLSLKAEFPNAAQQLWPGQFVNIRLLVSTLQGVVVVPTAAIQRGPNGAFVYAVDAENVVEVRPVELRMQGDTISVVASGVAVGEKVVTSGFTNLSAGAKVATQPPGGQPATEKKDPSVAGPRPESRGNRRAPGGSQP